MQFDRLQHPKAGIPTVQYIYRDASGAAVLIANRYEPKASAKFFLPYDVTRQDWKAPATRPLYNLDKITIADPQTPIWFVEGEKCADALASLGFLTTTSFGGCKALAKTDLSPLKGRKVLIWPDYDEPGQKYAENLQSELTKIAVNSVLSLEIREAKTATISANQCKSALMRGWDAADAVAAGWTAEMVEKLRIAPNSEDEISANAPKSTQISTDELELWHSPEREAFASISVDTHIENWAIGSTHILQVSR